MREKKEIERERERNKKEGEREKERGQGSRQRKSINDDVPDIDDVLCPRADWESCVNDRKSFDS